MNRVALCLRNKNLLSGLFFLLVAGIFAYGAVRLPMGSAVRMGPGYFPVLLSGLLAVLGIITLISGALDATERNAIAPLVWSQMLLVCGAAFLFVLTLDGLGFPGSVFLVVMVAARASRDFRLVPALILSALASAGAWIIFAEALGLPLSVLGSWLTGA